MSLPDDEIEGVVAFIHYMYEFDYTIAEPTHASALQSHAHIHSVADKYQCLGLKGVAARKFAKAARIHWRSPYFVEAIRFIYNAPSSSNQDLRGIVVNTTLERADRLVEFRDASADSPHAILSTAMLADEGEFSRDFICAMLRYKQRNISALDPNDVMMLELECQHCSGVWRLPKVNADYESIRKDCPICQQDTGLNPPILCKSNRTPEWVEA